MNHTSNLLSGAGGRRAEPTQRRHMMDRRKLAALAIGVVTAGSLATVGVASAARHDARPALVPLPPAPLPSVYTCAASPCAVTLHATTGSVGVKKGAATVTVPVWSFSLTGGATATLPGTVLDVPQGATVTVTLIDDLAQDVGLSIPSLPAGDLTGFGKAATASTPATYAFTAAAPGTFTYEAGNTTSAPRQVAMGLSGVIVVRPAVSTTGVKTAYANVPFDNDALVVLNDVDPAFAAAPLTYDFDTYQPAFHLINGKAFPETTAIDVPLGTTSLLRYANLSVKDKTMGLVGRRQTVVARNAEASTIALAAVSPLIGPGETLDATVSLPNDGTVAVGQLFALYEQGRGFNAQTPAGFGGALTLLRAAAAPIAPVAPLAPAARTALPDAATTTTTAASTKGATTTTTTAAATATTVGATTTTAGATTTTAGATTTRAAAATTTVGAKPPAAPAP